VQWANDPGIAAFKGLLAIRATPRGINIERLRDVPAEWSRRFEARLG
jgi:hypothetical protein